MTQAVVDHLEAIQVDEQNREEVTFPAPAVIDGEFQVINERARGWAASVSESWKAS